MAAESHANALRKKRSAVYHAEKRESMAVEGEASAPVGSTARTSIVLVFWNQCVDPWALCSPVGIYNAEYLTDPETRFLRHTIGQLHVIDPINLHELSSNIGNKFACDLTLHEGRQLLKFLLHVAQDEKELAQIEAAAAKEAGLSDERPDGEGELDVDWIPEEVGTEAPLGYKQPERWLREDELVLPNNAHGKLVVHYEEPRVVSEEARTARAKELFGWVGQPTEDPPVPKVEEQDARSVPVRDRRARKN
jgi:hypothetical protein